jgi:predicted nucleic acid-binding protein
MTVFGDAFYWVALLNRRDSYHDRVKRHAIAYRGSILTTQWVLAEVADALAASKVRESVRPFFQELASSDAFTLLDATGSLFRRGLDLYHDRPDKHWSLTDCISFVVMKEHGVSEALTGDQHFAQAGFTALFS